MKCSNKKIRKKSIFMITLLLCVLPLTGCGNNRGYNVKEPLHISSGVNLPIVRPAGLAAENVVIPYDAYVYDDSKMEYEAGLLINQTKNTVVCAVNPHKRIYPASMTKILTALVVMEAVEKGQISLTDTVVIQKKIEFNEDNVTVLGLEPGDYMFHERLILWFRLLGQHADWLINKKHVFVFI